MGRYLAELYYLYPILLHGIEKTIIAIIVIVARVIAEKEIPTIAMTLLGSFLLIALIPVTIDMHGNIIIVANVIKKIHMPRSGPEKPVSIRTDKVTIKIITTKIVQNITDGKIPVIRQTFGKFLFLLPFINYIARV